MNGSIWEGECSLLILTVHLKSKETNDETIELLKRERIHCVPEQMHIFLYPFPWYRLSPIEGPLCICPSDMLSLYWSTSSATCWSSMLLFLLAGPASLSYSSCKVDWHLLAGAACLISWGSTMRVSGTSSLEDFFSSYSAPIASAGSTADFDWQILSYLWFLKPDFCDVQPSCLDTSCPITVSSQ